ncbi:hypothetical protein PSAB6_60065 [Paraburkholderia sabiae]|jgi:hypothetical protein|nr:hypothetical protein PSAB6_60065 [Paraburkholderia sabiae]
MESLPRLREAISGRLIARIHSLAEIGRSDYRKYAISSYAESERQNVLKIGSDASVHMNGAWPITSGGTVYENLAWKG